MKNAFLILLSLACIAGAAYTFLNQTGHIPMVTMFLFGFALAVFLMTLKMNVKNTKLNSYKRELEKESSKWHHCIITLNYADGMKIQLFQCLV